MGECGCVLEVQRCKAHADDVVVVFTADEARALADHPATLQRSDPGTFWVNDVVRAVAVLNRARARALDGRQ